MILRSGSGYTTQALSPIFQVRERPWLWFGSAIASGFLLGRGRDRSSAGTMAVAFREDVSPLNQRVQSLARDWQPEWTVVKNLGLTMATQFLAEKLRKDIEIILWGIRGAIPDLSDWPVATFSERERRNLVNQLATVRRDIAALSHYAE